MMMMMMMMMMKGREARGKLNLERGKNKADL
jgi:hypothetical protein